MDIYQENCANRHLDVMNSMVNSRNVSRRGINIKVSTEKVSTEEVSTEKVSTEVFTIPLDTVSSYLNFCSSAYIASEIISLN